jgi:hypothetical protein
MTPQMMPPEAAPAAAPMTPEDALSSALEMIVSEDFAPAISAAFEGSSDIPTAVALLVFPIIMRMQQELDLPDDELFGTDEGDGIAIYLVQELIDIAGEAGYLPEEGDEEMGRQLGEATVAKLGELLNQAGGAMGSMPMQPGAPAPGAAPQPAPPQPGGLMQEGML